MHPLMSIVRDCLRANEPVALATVIDLQPSDGAPSARLPRLGAKIVIRAGARPEGTLGDPGLNAAVARDTRLAMEAGRSVTRRYGPDGLLQRGDITVFIEVFAPPRRMIIFGAVDFTGALVRVAKVLGYHVTVCDARPVFATATRFPEADEVVVDWPHRYLAGVADQLGPGDAICVLTHDHKFDIPALVAALDTEVGYIGAMGSRNTHAGRVERLRAEGVEPERIHQVRSPIGIDIGASTPEETAVAICAEIISVRSGAPAPALRDGTGPIHRVMS
jgi:xanthine dehydrogenase accessory factor